MNNIYIIDRIEENIVILNKLGTTEVIKVNKDDIVGICFEKNVIIQVGNKYVYSEQETKKRLDFIESITNGLWN